MRFSIGYDKKSMEFEVPDRNLLRVIEKKEFTPPLSESEEIARAIDHPIGTPSLDHIFRKGQRIAIITSDITRPVPSKAILEVLLERLGRCGVEDRDIRIVFALGSHRKHTEAEQRTIVGNEIYARIECLDSDPDDCVRLGVTRAGTPVDVTRSVAEADKRICLGNIEYHYFAGYSGGIKAIIPGVSNRAAIQANHSCMTKEGAEAGRIAGNPVRADIDETGRFISADFIVNVVIDEHRKVAGAFAGHYIDAHRAGCAFLDTLYKIPIERRADIVVTTPGGYPKDINLYQAQKALDNAKNAVRDGGIVIFAAACPEGMGERVFERWYSECSCPDDLIARVRTGFELGGHKAAAIAMVLRNARIWFVSDMPDDQVRSLFFRPFPSIDAALSAAFTELGTDAGVIVMPHAASTLPVPLD